MKTLPVLFLAAGLLSTTACVPPNARRHFGPPRPLTRMDCPKRQGELRLTSAAADGGSCSYTAFDGSEVDLKLIRVDNSNPDATLDALEGQLRPMVGAHAALPGSDEDADQDEARGDDGDWKGSAGSSTSQAAAKAEAQAKADARRSNQASGDSDHVNINLPGVHIQADNGRANVNVAGMHIDADDASQRVHVEGGHGPFGRPGRFSVDADDAGAIIRARSVGPDVRATLIIVGDTAGPQGWRAVGYEARGPRSGPLVVALTRSRSDAHDHVFDSAKRLAGRVAEG
jgi:hypothetical protein